MNIAVILAGGVGSRVGAKIPKQFIEVCGKPVIAYTIEIFEEHPQIDAIEVVCIEEYRDKLEDILKKYNYTKTKWIAQGGKDFQHSVLNGINYLKNKISDEDNVLVHWSASPFVTDEIISDAIKVCEEKGNAISTTPFYIISGYKEEDGKHSTRYIDRDTIACMNCPHAFKYGLIREMYDKAVESGVINEVEPHTTTLMYKMGIPIYFSKGSQTNIKITTKEDLELFEAYALMKQNKKQNTKKEDHE